jgi:hypothetical protein
VKGSIICLLLGLITLGCASTQRAAVPPDAVPVDEGFGIYRFGEVFEGAAVTGVFLVRNPSPFYLVIDEIEAPCGCTTAELAGEELPPRGEILVRVTLNTARLWGPQSKMIILHTNSPYRPKIKLLLEGVVLERLQLEPRRITAETDQAAYHATVRLTNVTDQPMQIEGLNAEPADLIHPALDQQTLPFTLAPGESVTLLIDIQLERSGAQLAGTVYIRLTGSEEPARLPVYVERH